MRSRNGQSPCLGRLESRADNWIIGGEMICRSVPIDVCCPKDRDRRSVAGRRHPYVREIHEETRTERRVEVLQADEGK
jgi:hypothetical protein